MNAPHSAQTRNASLAPEMPARPRHWMRLDSSVFWVLIGTFVLIILSFWSLDLQLARVLSFESLARMGRFLGELFSPNLEPVFLTKLLRASLETLAMSAVGTLLATIFGVLLAVPASRSFAGDPARWRFLTRLLLNVLRAIPELVWPLYC